MPNTPAISNSNDLNSSQSIPLLTCKWDFRRVCMKEVLRRSKGVTIFRRQYLGYKVKGEYGDGDLAARLQAQGKRGVYE